MPGDDTSTLYGEVKAWIAKQEAFEATTKKPAPLTNAQRKALEVLRLPLNPPTPPPEIGDVDYVSLLTRYRQAHPEGDGIDWDEAEASSKAVGGAIGRICRVSISEACDHVEAPVESFPAVGYGFDDGQQPPVFSRKKDAKKYAAKCAIDWLIAQSFMPDNLKDVSFPRGYIPSRPASSPSASSAIKRPTEGTDGVLTPPPKRPTKGAPPGGPVDFNDETLPAPQRVDALCAKLGLRSPTYSCSRTDLGLDGYYDGHPNFGHDHASVPGLDRVGWVMRVHGQDNARQEMARLVLEHLLPVYWERQSMFDSFSAPPEA